MLFPTQIYNIPAAIQASNRAFAAEKARSYTTLGIVHCCAFVMRPIVRTRPNGVLGLATRWLVQKPPRISRSAFERTWLPLFWWLCVGDPRVCRFCHVPVRQPTYSYHPIVWRRL